jgi:hypothetical protein
VAQRWDKIVERVISSEQQGILIQDLEAIKPFLSLINSQLLNLVSGPPKEKKITLVYREKLVLHLQDQVQAHIKYQLK